MSAGIARVVVATGDPFLEVNGAGIARLRAAGVVVEMADAGTDTDIANAARELNIGFFSRVQRGRPWLRLKIAASLDGRTALDDGQSQWITGPQARADGHAWRRRAGAVLTGIGTVLHDNPRLDVRLVPTQLPPLRVVLDSALQMPTSARLLAPPGRVLIVCASPQPERAAALAAFGAETQCLPGADGRVSLPGLLHTLAQRGVNELHVEAGAALNGALLAAGLVDELLIYQAPLLVGPGRGMANLAPLVALEQAPRFHCIDVVACGPDLRLRLRPAASASLA